MKERFNGPYVVQETSHDWYENFFSDTVHRGFAMVLNNVNSEGTPVGKTVLFRCPCEHAETMNLPINSDGSGIGWGFSKDAEGKMTLTPSIQQHPNKAPNGKHLHCDSHFFIRNGMVDWC